MSLDNLRGKRAQTNVVSAPSLQPPDKRKGVAPQSVSDRRGKTRRALGVAASRHLSVDRLRLTSASATEQTCEVLIVRRTASVLLQRARAITPSIPYQVAGVDSVSGGRLGPPGDRCAEGA